MAPPVDPAPDDGSAAPGPGPRWFLVALMAVLAMSFNLRPVATAVGPVLEEVSADLHLGPEIAGVLTALPGLVFGLIAGVSVALARRLGVTAALVVGLVILGVGLLARSLAGSAAVLILLTVVALSGAAIGNVLLPAFIKRHFVGREARVMSGYAASLGLGAMIAALVSAPVAAHVPGGWRSALGSWGLVALLALVPWLVMLVHERRLHGGAPPRAVAFNAQVWRSRQAVALAVFFGVQSMQAYVQFGWAAQMFRDAGLTPTAAGSLMALIAAFGVPSGLLMPLVVARVHDLRPIMIGLGVLLSAGYLGILWWPTTVPWLWATCLGLSAFAFPTALALMTARTRNPAVTAKVSGFTQSLGYRLAAAGPFAVGAMLAVTGSWHVPLIVLAACGPILAWTGVIAARHRFIDDDLGERLGVS